MISHLLLLQTEAEVIKAATLTWRQWHLNYYHGFGESVFEVFALACKYLHFCGGSNSADLVPIFIERGQANDQASWAQFLPAAETALKCLFPGSDYFIGDERIRHKVNVKCPVSPTCCWPYHRGTPYATSCCNDKLRLMHGMMAVTRL